jgi:hypothetical protein
MSTKTRTRTTSTRAAGATTGTTGSAPTLRPVPDPDTAPVAAGRTTEDKLWAALHAHPNSTAADLSTTAGIGKSTAAKILARLAGEGSVTRTSGIADGGRRAADLWAITTAADTTADSPADTVAPDRVEQDDVDPVVVDDPATADNPEATHTTPADGVHPEPTDPTPTDDAPASADTEPDTATAPDVQGAAAPEVAATVAAEPVTDPTVSTAEGGASAATADGDGAGVKAARLAPGALRGMVDDHLRDHPGQEFSPVEIARELGGKSTGAVSNALDKLVEDKIAVQTKDRPRRYALAPTEATAAASA